MPAPLPPVRPKTKKTAPGPLGAKPGTTTHNTPHPAAKVFQDRARQRLAKIRVNDPEGLPGVKPSAHGNFTKQQRIAIMQAAKKLHGGPTATTGPPLKKGKPYNPLEPIGGQDFDNEVSAATKLQFGGQEEALRAALAQQDRNSQVVGSGMDQYRQALEEARQHIASTNEKAATDSQAQFDTAYSQDSAAQAARDAAVKELAQRAGMTVGPSQEGAQAVAGARSQGNQSVANIRSQGAADDTLMTKRGATSVLQKTEALSRQQAKRSELEGKGTELAAEKGAFSVAERQKLRDSERTYALARKEFGLKAADVKSQINTRKATVSADKQKANAQVLVAKIYASADRAKARATIRVAQLQLKKGKIDQKQYRQIVNIYKGLPKKGTSSQPKSAAPGANQGGSGAGGALAPYEVDKRDKALQGYTKNKYGKDDHDRAIEKAVKAGIPQRLAELAWKKYLKSLTTPYDKGYPKTG
jgi:hypothetical protein